MKKIYYFFFLGITAFTLFSFRQVQSVFDNIFEQLGLQAEEANSYIDANIIDGSASFPTTRIMASLAFNKREEAVKAIGQYVKDYVQSPAFAGQYKTVREDQKPQKPEGLYQNQENMMIYREDLKRWEADYPVSIKALLKQRLTQFLQQTASIDYAARLVPSGRKMVFADPALEAKDPFWKACFRSGKRTVDAARAFAQQWLAELK
ncbi:MAG TPA: hypothetical protein VGE06_08905, partial [Flavisolibacter sp.]